MGTYEAVHGFFLHDTVNDHAPLEAVPARFGLLDGYSWPQLFNEIKKLNAEGSHKHKLFFLARHGQGYHNVAEAKYGTKAWDEHWSKLATDGLSTWAPDPELTDIGLQQAANAQKRWKEEISLSKDPILVPGKFLCSPMSRSIRTCIITFDGIASTEEFKPLILENCREEYGEHLCDKRATRSEIAHKFPQMQFEHGFAEQDALWTPDERETLEHAAGRARAVLDYVFENESADFVSITAHSGIISAFLRVLNRPNNNTRPIPTGGVLPVIIKTARSS